MMDEIDKISAMFAAMLFRLNCSYFCFSFGKDVSRPLLLFQFPFSHPFSLLPPQVLFPFI